MQNVSEFGRLMLDLLNPLQPITIRRMFGGEGLFKHGKMFAIIDDGTLYLKADDESSWRFVQAGCEKFTYLTTRAGVKKQVALNYYQLPESALDDVDELYEWAMLGIRASQNTPKSHKDPLHEPHIQ